MAKRILIDVAIDDLAFELLKGSENRIDNGIPVFECDTSNHPMLCADATGLALLAEAQRKDVEFYSTQIRIGYREYSQDNDLFNF